METLSDRIPIVISALATGSASVSSTSLAAQIALCVAEALDRGSIVVLPAGYGTLRLATLDAAELEAIRTWLRGGGTHLYLLVDLKVLHRDAEAVAALQGILDQAGFRVISVALWMLAPLWAAEGLRSSIDAGPLPCTVGPEPIGEAPG